MEDFSKELTTYGFTALRTFNKIGSFNYSPIYHYTSANGLLGILDKDNIKLWFTQYDCLNDKNERIDALNTLIEYCEDKYKNKVISEELLLKIKDIKMSDDITVLNEICEPIVVGSGETIESYTEMAIDESYTYLCCFSTNPDSLSMWNYYSKSKNYEGYSIGISHVHFYTPNEKERKYELYLKKVVYTKKEKYELFDEYLLPLLKLYDSDTPINKIRTLNMITTSINFKSSIICFLVFAICPGYQLIFIFPSLDIFYHFLLLYYLLF